MRVVFVLLPPEELFAYGLLTLTAGLRAAGHSVALAFVRNTRELLRHPQVESADVVAFSVTTGLHRVYVEWAHALRHKWPSKILVMGGPHSTFFPEVLHTAPLDGVCIGEGEQSFGEFLAVVCAGFPSIPAGWWIRRDQGSGPVECGPSAVPIHDLNQLPVPAYDLFYESETYCAPPLRIFMATRGCPYSCTYCYNRTLNEWYSGQGRRVRVSDPERLADRIEQVRRRWGLPLTWFLDANFVANPAWLRAFLDVYKRRIHVPFFCKLRAERATPSIVRLLAEAGCVAVGVGIESGSERVRREILERRVSNQEILDGCHALKAHGIKVLAFNMLGIPGETFDEALSTVALNVAAMVDHGGATILQPYPKTEIARRAIEERQFDGDFEALDYSYYADSPFRYSSERERDRFTNLQRLFALAVEFPEVRRRLRRLVDRPPSRIFYHLFVAHHSWSIHHRFHRLRGIGRPRQALPDALEHALQELSD